MQKNPKLSAQRMKEAADLLKKHFPGLGFSLIAFEFDNTENDMSYISNAQRADMIGTLEQLLDKWKNNKPVNN